MNHSVYIAAVFIAVLVLLGGLVSWVSRYKKKEKLKKLTRDFNDLVVKNNLIIDKKQTLSNNMIGLDRTNMKLLFIDKNKIPQKIHLVNLNDLSDCRLIKSRNKGEEHISNISLECIFKDKKTAKIILPFYDALTDDLYKMMRLSKKASYWEKRINIFREISPVSEIKEEIKA